MVIKDGVYYFSFSQPMLLLVGWMMEEADPLMCSKLQRDDRFNVCYCLMMMSSLLFLLVETIIQMLKTYLVAMQWI
jgi:hypothetical protein